MNENHILRTLDSAMPGLCPAVALALAYPSKSIRLIVPFPADGGGDFICRIAGKGLSE